MCIWTPYCLPHSLLTVAIIPEIPKFPVKSDNDNMGSIYPYESYCVHCGA